MKKNLVILGFGILSLGSNATSYTSSGVSKIYAGYTNKGVFFDATTSNSINVAACGAGLTANTFGVDPSLSDVSHVLSVLMYAQSTNKEVVIEFYDDKCFSNHRVIRKVAVKG